MLHGMPLHYMPLRAPALLRGGGEELSRNDDRARGSPPFRHRSTLRPIYVYLFVYLSIYLFIFLSFYLFICLSINSFIYLIK